MFCFKLISNKWPKLLQSALMSPFWNSRLFPINLLRNMGCKSYILNYNILTKTIKILCSRAHWITGTTSDILKIGINTGHPEESTVKAVVFSESLLWLVEISSNLQDYKRKLKGSIYGAFHQKTQDISMHKISLLGCKPSCSVGKSKLHWGLELLLVDPSNPWSWIGE